MFLFVMHITLRFKKKYFHVYNKLTLRIVAANNTTQKIKTFIIARVHFSNTVYCEMNNVKEIYIDCDIL